MISDLQEQVIQMEGGVGEDKGAEFECALSLVKKNSPQYQSRS